MEIVDEVRLHYCEGTSDKVYRIVVEKHTDGLGSLLMPMYRVMAYWGRRTSPNAGQQEKVVTPSPGQAVSMMREIMGEKIGKGYVLLPASPAPRKVVMHAPVVDTVATRVRSPAADLRP